LKPIQREAVLDNQTLEFLKHWFDGYVSSFHSENTEVQWNIDIKVEHSHRVCECILEIERSLGLDPDCMRLAEAAALFHDVGRFEQLKRYKTFSDHRSVDHAELGVQVLREHRVLERLEKPAQDILLRAVRNHNRLAIPEDESETVRFFSRLVRDADKLDIWRVVSEHYCSEDGRENGVGLGLPDTPGNSEAVVNDLLNHRLVLMSHLQNVNDFKLLQLGWVYDVNFPKTLELLDQRGYLKSIRNVLPDSKEVDEVYREVNLTIQKRIH
jgi:putative nucleotidyltransferase with HDIG domain